MYKARAGAKRTQAMSVLGDFCACARPKILEVRSFYEK